VEFHGIEHLVLAFEFDAANGVQHFESEAALERRLGLVIGFAQSAVDPLLADHFTDGEEEVRVGVEDAVDVV